MGDLRHTGPEERQQQPIFRYGADGRLQVVRGDDIPSPPHGQSIDRSRIIVRHTSPYPIDSTMPTQPASQPKFGRKIKKRGRKFLLVGAASTMTVVMMVTGLSFYKHQHDPGSNTETATDVLTAIGPAYPTILPTGKKIEELGGWKRASPINKDPVYAYTDRVGTVNLSVTEQPLPTSFRQDISGEVAKFAKDFEANTKIGVGNGLSAYIGTAKDGSQAVIFAQSEVLILIKATAILTNQQWTTYLVSLQ